ncbi:MAG: RHS repeat-associated core domain-containing protein [Verrucomicrobia bacterium]|nr:RHS repeat-associated core domain-containing protein [Verrucomicrobiota bacterium]
MKPRSFAFVAATALGLMLALRAVADGPACATGEPVRAHLTFKSLEGEASLIGFDAFVSTDPATPPKVFRRREVAGTMTVGAWSDPNCPPPSLVTVFTDRGHVETNFNAWPGPAFSWEAKLEPVRTESDGRILYRATTSVTPDVTQTTPFEVAVNITVDLGQAGDSEDITFVNGDEKYLDPFHHNPPFTVGVFSPQLRPWGASLGGTPQQIFSKLIGQIRDTWQLTREYDADDPLGHTLVIDVDTSQRVEARSPTFPFSLGIVGYGTPVAADYAGLVTELLTVSSRTLTASQDCVAVAGGSRKAQGSYLETLSIEDTEADAERRASSDLAIAQELTVRGRGNQVYRTNRFFVGPGSIGRTFYFSRTQVVARFDQSACCPGDYNLMVRYTETPLATGEESKPRKAFLTQAKLGSVDQVLTYDFKVGFGPFTQRDVIYSIISVTAEPLCANPDPGGSGGDQDSIHFWMNLGRAAGQISAGQLRIDAEEITPALYTPAALALTAISVPGIEPVQDAAGLLRQVKAPQAFADIVPRDPALYEVSFYAPEHVGAQNSTTKIHAFTGPPFATYRIENPDVSSGRTERLRITETRPGLSRVTEFAYNEATASWSFSQGGGLRQESTVTADIAGDTVKTTTVRNATGQLVTQRARTYRRFAWGEELIREVLDPAGAALTTSFEFYEDDYSTRGRDGNETVDPNYRQLRQRTNPDGSWERYAYATGGRVARVTRPFLVAPPDSQDEPLLRITDHAYNPLPDADGDGEPELLQTTSERTFATETARRYRVEWSRRVVLGDESCKRYTDVVCTTAGAAWDATGNLVTESLAFATGPFANRYARIVNPDGTASLTSYALSTGGVLTTTIKTGLPNAARTDIVDGRRTVTFTSAAGQTTTEAVTDIASGLALTSWTATTFDSVGRPTRIDHSDGTYVTRTYACCGLASERDRTGLVTTYGYDLLGRQTSVTRAGITIRTGYDADGRVTSITRIGTDNSETIQTTNAYDRGGRLISRRDALNRATTFAETFDSASGRTTRTTTNPDGGIRVEIFARSGALLSVDGTAAAPRGYDYALDGDGLYTKEIPVSLDSNGQPSTQQWTKTYSDFAGRTSKVVFADGATSRSFYNAAGQLVRQTDPDGVTTLFAYNNLGEPEVTALDLNGNNVIDYAGPDRITRTTRTTAAKPGATGTFTVQRTATQVWSADNQDTPVTVSVSEQTPDGLRAWLTAHGLTSTTVTAFDGSGGRIVTATGPDSVQTVQTYAADRLASTVTKTAAGSQLSATTLAYDSHGRVQSSTDARNGTTTFSYFADDQLRTITTPDPDSTRTGPGYDAQITTYAYDTAGRVASVTHPDGGVVQTTYYPTGAIKRTWGARTYPVEYAYDPQGRVKTLTTWQSFAADSGRAVTTWNYDPLRGFLLNKRYADGTGPSYTYQPSGRLLTRTWARGIVTTYSYTAAGETSSASYSDSTPGATFTYDRLGRVITKSDGTGSCVYTYQGLTSLVTAETHSSGALAGIAVGRGYDSLFRASSLTATALPAVTYCYDSASRLQTVTAGPNTATYAYEPNSPLVASVTFRNDATTRLTSTKSYDRLNRLTTINHTPGGTSPALNYAYTYNTANQRTRVTREDNSSWSYGYDSLGQVTSGKKLLADNTAALGGDYAWTFDDIGNRQTATTNTQVATYTANSLNQYTQRTVPGAIDVLGAAAATATVTVAVNNGAPQATTRQGETFYKQITLDNTTAAQTAQLKITGVKNLAGPNAEDAVAETSKTAFLSRTPETFHHDPDGNLTDDARWHYTWDAENRLIALETTGQAAAAGLPRQKLEFAYDSQSRRISKKVSTGNGTTWTLAYHTHFLYDGWLMLAELNALAANAPIRTYLWGRDLSGTAQGAGGIGGLLTVTDHNSATAASHLASFDGNGNLTALTSASNGTSTASYDYNAFGELKAIEDLFSSANPFGFSTKFTDFETGHLYYGYRSYSSSAGRWLSRDPLGERGGTNLYAMVGNDPINFVDPFGLWQLGNHTRILDNALKGLDCNCCNFQELSDGLHEGVLQPDIPGGKVWLVGVYVDAKAMPNYARERYKNDETYRSHFGDLQVFHGMHSIELTPQQLQDRLVSLFDTVVSQATALVKQGKCREAGRLIGISLHTLQDSFSRSHIVRNDQWQITQFQNYNEQSGTKHKVADKAVDSPEFKQAIEMTRDYLGRILCKDNDKAALESYVRNRLFPLAPNATVGGSAPPYRK